MSATSHPTSLLCAGAWRVLAWICVLLIAAILAVVWSAGDWTLVLALGIFLVAGLGIQLLHRKLPGVFLFLLVLAALLNGAGGAFGWLDSIVWYDEVVHGYTGFAGLSAIGYLYARDRPRGRSALIAWCTAMGLALGAGWEVVESLFGPLGLMDTISDLVFDTVGAAFGGLFAAYALREVPAHGSRRLHRAESGVR